MTTHLKISSSNTDLNGNWFKKDVEDEIREILGREPDYSTEWINWTFSHLFDGMGAEVNAVVEAVASAEWITEIKFETPDHDKVHIIKR